MPRTISGPKPTRRSIRQPVRQAAQTNRNAQRAQRRQVAQMNKGAREMGRSVAFSRRGTGGRNTGIFGRSTAISDVQAARDAGLERPTGVLIPGTNVNTNLIRAGTIGQQPQLNNPFLTGGLGFNPAVLNPITGQQGGPKFSVAKGAKDMSAGQGQMEQSARARLTGEGITGQTQEDQLAHAKQGATAVMQHSGKGASYSPGMDSPAMAIAELERKRNEAKQRAHDSDGSGHGSVENALAAADKAYYDGMQKLQLEIQAGAAQQSASQVAQNQNQPVPPADSFISQLPEEQQGPAEDVFAPLFEYYDQATQDAMTVHGNSMKALDEGDSLLNDYIGLRNKQDEKMFDRHDEFYKEQLQHQLDGAERTRDSQEAIIQSERRRQDYKYEKAIQRQRIQNERDRKDLLLDLGISGGWRASAKVADVYDALKEGERIIADMEIERIFMGEVFAAKMVKAEGDFFTNEQKAHDAYKSASLQLEDKMMKRASEIDKTVYNHAKDRTNAVTKMENDFLNSFTKIAGERAKAAVDNNKWMSEQALKIAQFEHNMNQDKFSNEMEVGRFGISMSNLQNANKREAREQDKWNKVQNKVDLDLTRAAGGIAKNEYGENVIIDGYPLVLPGSIGGGTDGTLLGSTAADQKFLSPSALYSRTSSNFSEWFSRIGNGQIRQDSPYHKIGTPDEHAVDIPGQVGSSITPFVESAAFEINTDPNHDYGIYVRAVDNQGHIHLYAHLNSIDEGLVAQRLAGNSPRLYRGQEFAQLGNTGKVLGGSGETLDDQQLQEGRGAHLHYSIMNGQTGEPMPIDQYIPITDNNARAEKLDSPYVDALWEKYEAQGFSKNRIAELIVADAEADPDTTKKFVEATKANIVFRRNQGDRSILEPSPEGIATKHTEEQRKEFIKVDVDFMTRLRQPTTLRQVVKVGKKIMEDNPDYPLQNLYEIYAQNGFYFDMRYKGEIPSINNLIRSTSERVGSHQAGIGSLPQYLLKRNAQLIPEGDKGTLGTDKSVLPTFPK